MYKNKNKLIILKINKIQAQLTLIKAIYKTEIGKCEKFQIRENPKSYKSDNILVHELIKCNTCLGVYNRDIDGAINIYRIAKKYNKWT